RRRPPPRRPRGRGPRGRWPLRWLRASPGGVRYPAAVGLYVHHSSSYEHETGAHPENAGRLRAVEAELARRGWLGLDRRAAPAATEEQLLRVHSAEHLRAIEDLAAGGGGMVDADTVASPSSWEAALHAAGGSAWAEEALMAGEVRSAIWEP